MAKWLALWIVDVAPNIALVLADIIVVVSTWWKTYRSARDAWNLHLGDRVSTVMLTHGTSHYYLGPKSCVQNTFLSF